MSNGLDQNRRDPNDGQQRVTALQAAIAGQEVVNKEYKRVKIRIAFSPLDERFEVANPAIDKDKTWFHDIAPIINDDIKSHKVVRNYLAINPDANEDFIYERLARLTDIVKKQIGMKRITLLTQNRSGVVAEITEALAAKNINIETLDAEDIADAGIITLSVDRHDDALHVFSEMPDITAISENAILIKLKDQPGALASIARRFKDAEINIRSMHIFRQGEYGLVAISTECTEEALSLVKDVIIK